MYQNNNVLEQSWGNGSITGTTQITTTPPKTLCEKCIKISKQIMTLLLLTFAILSLIIAFQEENDHCQKGKRGGLILSDWLKGATIELLVYTVFVVIMIGGLVCCMRNNNHKAVMGISIVVAVVMYIHILFEICWFIWGMVLLVTPQNSQCITKTTTLGVFAVINLFCILLDLIFGEKHVNITVSQN